MDNKKQNVIKRAISIVKSHISDAISEIKTNASDNAKTNYDLDFNLLKPNFNKIKNELVEYNKSNKGKGIVLELKEMKAILVDSYKQTVKAIKNDKSSDDPDDFFASFDIDGMNWDDIEDYEYDENMEFGGESEMENEIIFTKEALIKSYANCVIMGVASHDARIAKFIAQRPTSLSDCTELDPNVIGELRAEVGVIKDNEVEVSDKELNDIIETANDETANSNLAIAMYSDEVGAKIGTEEASVASGDDVERVLEEIYALASSSITPEDVNSFKKYIHDFISLVSLELEGKIDRPLPNFDYYMKGGTTELNQAFSMYNDRDKAICVTLYFLAELSNNENPDNEKGLVFMNNLSLVLTNQIESLNSVTEPTI